LDVSVVIPTRNRSALLAMSLRGVLAQRDVALEVIVVDEASEDDTRSVIAKLDDPRIRVVRHDTCQGVSAARNRGVAEARAEWIAFLDDDDLWAPDKLAQQLHAARETGAPWVYVGHVNVNIHNEVTGGEPPLLPEALLRELPARNVVPGGCSGVMVSKRALASAGGFDVRLQPLADWDLWLRLARTGPPACVPRPLVAYRVHGHQMSLDAARVEREFSILSERYPQASPSVIYRYLGWWALRVKDHRAALRLFVRGWRRSRGDYGYRLLVTDLSGLVRDVLEHRLNLHVSRGGVARDDRDREQSWRAEGRAWVDALCAAHP
jgi:glycosyltransferase involved in cell wall biosynthesis